MARKKTVQSELPVVETRSSLLAKLTELEKDSRFNQGNLQSAKDLVEGLDEKLEIPKMLPSPPYVNLYWRMGDRELKVSVVSPSALEYVLLEGRAKKIARRLRFSGKVPMELERLLNQFI